MQVVGHLKLTHSFKRLVEPWGRLERSRSAAMGRIAKQCALYIRLDPHAAEAAPAEDENLGFRIQDSGFRSQKSGVRSQESEVRSQESEVRSQKSEVRSQE